MNFAFLACCLLAQMAFTARGDDGGSELTLRHCLIDYAQSSMVGASELGVIQESHVQRGSVVRAGQVLAHLPDGEVRAKLDQCKIEAASDLDYKLHVLHHKQAVNKLRISTNLRSRQRLAMRRIWPTTLLLNWPQLRLISQSNVKYSIRPSWKRPRRGSRPAK